MVEHGNWNHLKWWNEGHSCDLMWLKQPKQPWAMVFLAAFTWSSCFHLWSLELHLPCPTVTKFGEVYVSYCGWEKSYNTLDTGINHRFQLVIRISQPSTISFHITEVCRCQKAPKSEVFQRLSRVSLDPKLTTNPAVARELLTILHALLCRTYERMNMSHRPINFEKKTHFQFPMDKTWLYPSNPRL